MGPTTFSKKELVANFEGDEEILVELISEFLLKKNDLINALETAIKENNYDRIQLTSHTLKGVVSNFYAEDLRLKFCQIEKNAHEKKVVNYSEDLNSAKNLLNEFVNELQEFKKLL